MGNREQGKYILRNFANVAPSNFIIFQGFEGRGSHISKKKYDKKPKNLKFPLGQGDVQPSARKEPPPEQLLRQVGAQDPRGVPKELEGLRLRVLGEADHQVLRRVSRGMVKKAGPRLRDQASWLPRGLVDAT